MGFRKFMSHLIFILGKVIMHEILTLSITILNHEREKVRPLSFIQSVRHNIPIEYWSLHTESAANEIYT